MSENISQVAVMVKVNDLIRQLFDLLCGQFDHDKDGPLFFTPLLTSESLK